MMIQSIQRTAGLVLICLLALILGACSIITPKPPSRVIDPQVEAATTIEVNPQYGTLRILRPKTDQTRDSRQILVRRADSSLQVLPRHLWLEKTPDMLRTIMLNHFHQSGPFIDAHVGGPADWLLDTRIRSFEAVDLADGRVEVNIELFARLIEQRSGQVKNSRTLTVSIPSQSSEPEQIILAFERGLSEWTAQLADWLTQGVPLTD